MENGAIRDSLVVFENNQGFKANATVLKLTRQQVVFETYTPFLMVRLSEALADFRILMGERVAYSGRAVVTDLINAGTALVCEAHLEDAWVDVDSGAAAPRTRKLSDDLLRFLNVSDSAFKVRPECKLVVADMQILLSDLRHWLEQVELEVFSRPTGSRQQSERELVQELAPTVVPLLGALFEKLEAVCQSIDRDARPAHRAYVKRQLHPLVLCSPFMYRTFRKPLGYAGDYEMVNMMVRDPLEGASLFAKLLNFFFLSTPPVVAHRNRLEYLQGMLQSEVARAAAQRRRCKIFNLGCGPAWEVQEFVRHFELSNRADFTLVDFNEETLAYTGRVLREAIQRAGRTTSVQLVRKAVVQLLKEAAKPSSALLSSDYDLVYCAGLFDYLPENICQQLMSVFYRMVAPGGLVVATNVAVCNPSRNWMEYSVDWHLIYRDANQMQKLVPPTAPPDSGRILSEPSGVNTIIEIRKPKYG